MDDNLINDITQRICIYDANTTTDENLLPPSKASNIALGIALGILAITIISAIVFFIIIW